VNPLTWIFSSALVLACVACNTERAPEKRGPGEGFSWTRDDLGDPRSSASASPSPAHPLPAALAKKAPLNPVVPAAPASTSGGAIDLAKLDKRLVFSDDFDRPALGADWTFTAGDWQLKDNAVHSTKALNKCLWLKKPIPERAVVELEAWSMTPRGDIKFTVFGDGTEHETGYTLILGGWFNSISIIARGDEHGADRKERHDKGVVQPGKRYRLEMRRVGGRIDWLVDGRPYLHYDDAAPFVGPGHDRFAFCNWEVPLFFDNLRIYELVPKAAAPLPSPPSKAPPKPAPSARPPAK
jgi:hypothetical protein